jgi:hypothetical protein
MQWLAGTQGPTAHARVLDLRLSRETPLCAVEEPLSANELYRNPYQHPYGDI